jgi:hypothetical protein
MKKLYCCLLIATLVVLTMSCVTAGLYDDASGTEIEPSLLIMPFKAITYTARYHIIAFFDGHPDYESIEAFVFGAESAEGNPRIKVILTRHDKSQIDLVNWQDAGRTDREVYFSPDIAFEYTDRGRSALLEFRDQNGQKWSLVYLADYPVDKAWGGMTDVRGHSPDGGLPVFYRDLSGIGNEQSCILCQGITYSVTIDENASNPPFFVARMVYVSEGYNSFILGTGKHTVAVDSLVLSHQQNRLDMVDGPFSQRVDIVWKEGHPEIQSISSSCPLYSPDRSVLMAFDPPLADAAGMKTGARQTCRFSLSFGGAEPVVGGQIILEKTGRGQAVYHLVPEYPAWTRQSRAMKYTVTMGSKSIDTEAAMEH